MTCWQIVLRYVLPAVAAGGVAWVVCRRIAARRAVAAEAAALRARIAEAPKDLRTSDFDEVTRH